jgi:hypothetical protein
MHINFNLPEGKYFMGISPTGKSAIWGLLTIFILSPTFIWLAYTFLFAHIFTLPYISWWQIMLGCGGLWSLRQVIWLQNSEEEIEVKKKQ